MQGDIVRAAKWLGGSIVAASLICVVGFHPAVTGRTIQIVDTRPAATSDDVPVHLPPERIHGAIMLAPAIAEPGRCEAATIRAVDLPPEPPARQRVRLAYRAVAAGWPLVGPVREPYITFDPPPGPFGDERAAAFYTGHGVCSRVGVLFDSSVTFPGGQELAECSGWDIDR